jgi:hypothetical protein
MRSAALVLKKIFEKIPERLGSKISVRAMPSVVYYSQAPFKKDIALGAVFQKH